MKLPRRNFLHLAAGAAALPAVSRIARAQTYPSRPVRWIIGFPPGGGADQVARLIAPSLSERLGQQVVIENRPGAGTFLSVQAVLNSAPDGYTLLHYGGSTLMNAKISANPPPLEVGIAPVAGLVAYPMILVAHPLLLAKTVPELIDYAKSNPGKVTMASFGIGTASHLAGELLKQMAGIDMVHVPYRGGAPMITDLLAGQVQIGFDVMVTSLPHVRTGALRALAVAGSRRYEALPEVPTIAETLPGYEARTWAGVGAPKGTPAAVIARLVREIGAVLAEPTIEARLADLAQEIFLRERQTPEALGAFHKAEVEKWWPVIRAARGRRIPPAVTAARSPTAAPGTAADRASARRSKACRRTERRECADRASRPFRRIAPSL
jgi:tripartite-type tricarboxylate transporter receptor subunit TctC